jgi:hypothetical protein
MYRQPPYDATGELAAFDKVAEQNGSIPAGPPTHGTADYRQC